MSTKSTTPYSTTDWLADQLDRAAAAQAAAQAEIGRTRAALRELVVYTVRAGVPVDQVAARAGLSRAMTYRIVQHHRPNPDDF